VELVEGKDAENKIQLEMHYIMVFSRTFVWSFGVVS
jgi:hypothetical protein